MRRTITIPTDQWEETKRLLSLQDAEPGCDQDGILLQWTAKFGNGLEADVKVVNSPSGPWAECVLFDAGREVGCSEVTDNLESEFIFEVDDSYYYTVSCVEGK